MTNADSVPARTQFFARTALLMVACALSSFPFTYFMPLTTGTRPFAALHHIHAAMFFAWLGLYVWQTRLAATGRVARHRELGLLWLVVTGTMLPLGWWMALYAARARIERGEANPFVFTFYNIVDISLFGLAVIGALVTIRRNVEWHRRFMFAAALNLVGPAISRWLIPLGNLPRWTDFAPNILADLFLIALALHDRRQFGRVPAATLVALLVMVPLHLIEPRIATTEWWAQAAPALLKFD
ncbi:MAG TPA: hypothetical protein VHG29_08235 [Novosphingobium sp.]|nr:hypothetical protein [Novosphingobium sp.]